MKKFLLMSTLCALALVGCKDDSEPEIPTDIDYPTIYLNVPNKISDIVLSITR